MHMYMHQIGGHPANFDRKTGCLEYVKRGKEEAVTLVPTLRQLQDEQRQSLGNSAWIASTSYSHIEVDTPVIVAPSDNGAIHHDPGVLESLVGTLSDVEAIPHIRLIAEMYAEQMIYADRVLRLANANDQATEPPP